MGGEIALIFCSHCVVFTSSYIRASAVDTAGRVIDCGCFLCSVAYLRDFLESPHEIPSTPRPAGMFAEIFPGGQQPQSGTSE